MNAQCICSRFFMLGLLLLPHSSPPNRSNDSNTLFTYAVRLLLDVCHDGHCGVHQRNVHRRDGGALRAAAHRVRQGRALRGRGKAFITRFSVSCSHQSSAVWAATPMVSPLRRHHGVHTRLALQFQPASAHHSGKSSSSTFVAHILYFGHTKNGLPWQGCEGGDFTGGLHYIITHGGINTEETYPYLAHDSKCDRKAEQG